MLGASTLFACAGMALGPPVGGWILYDTTDMLAGWLYIRLLRHGARAPRMIMTLFCPSTSARAVALRLPPGARSVQLE